MNSLIPNQRKLMRCSYSYSRMMSKYNKFFPNNYRSYTSLRYRLDSSANHFVSTPILPKHRLPTITRYTTALSNVVVDEDRKYSGSAFLQNKYSYDMRRQFHLNHRLYENMSSKVEATVQTMKNKQKEKVEEIMKEAAEAAIQVDSTATLPPVKTADAVVKKPLKTRIWEEVLHYYHGFKLLFIDINISRKLLWRVLNGKTLTRRENKLLLRTTSDLFRLIPFSMFIIVPFMELLLPVFIKFFPGMLPSTFQTAADREDKLRKSMQVKLEMAKFLQKTLDEMAVQHREHKSEEAKQFATFFERIKNPNDHVDNDDIIKYAKRFEDEMTLDSLSREQLSALCRLLELNTMGTTNFLRFQLRMKLRSLTADDRVIAREGVNALDLFELQQACKSRGMRAYGLTAERLRSQLQEWIDLSLNEKVPQTLLLLSRAMQISDESTTTDKLKETIRVLPDSVAAQTKASIGEREGKIDNKTKIEIIKEEERKIKEEREEEREEEKVKAEILLDKAPIIDEKAAPSTTAAEAILQATATAPKPKVKEVLAEPTDEKGISSKDVELLSEALKTLSSDKNTNAVEKETIKDIKEELEDYKEDVQELHEVRNVVQEPVRETRGAKMLYKKVNNMIGQLDQLLQELEKKHRVVEDATLDRKSEELVRIDDLVQTIQKLKQTSSESRLKQIENILSKLDTDKDGVITVEEVLNVVEALGRDNVNLTEKQIEELIQLLDKEQVIEAEDKIEKALAKSVKDAQKIITETKEVDDSQKRAEAAMAKEELKDPAPELKDNATDLNETDKKHVIQTETKAHAAETTSLLEAAEKQKEKLIPKTDISAAIPSTIPPPTATTSSQANPKDKML